MASGKVRTYVYRTAARPSASHLKINQQKGPLKRAFLLLRIC